MDNTQTLTLRNDYLFKLLLGSEENKVCLQDFLEYILDIPIEIHFLNLSVAQKFGIQKSPIEKQQKLINWLQSIKNQLF